jgi:hypothetical protein
VSKKPVSLHYNLLFLLLGISQIVFIVIGQWLRGPNWQWILPY